MSHFYGSVKGMKGEATRTGSKGSGMTAIAASWSGAGKAETYYDEVTELDFVTLSLIGWKGRGVSRVVYDGPVDGRVVPNFPPMVRGALIVLKKSRSAATKDNALKLLRGEIAVMDVILGQYGALLKAIVGSDWETAYAVADAHNRTVLFPLFEGYRSKLALEVK